jgi:radical SAM superfamily enzyme YgiQ (UPF0313 family)
VDEVIGELKTLGRSLVFMDDNIIADKDYAKELFSKMAPLKKTWFSQSSIGIAHDDELLRLAAGSGCRGMFIGLESLSQENLNGCNKTFNRASDYVRAIQKIHSAGIGVFAGIVFGMDSDKPDVFGKTLEFLYKAQADALQATILTPFPGTPLFEEMQRAGRITDRDWSRYDFRNVVFEPRNMSAETLKRGHDWVLKNFYSKTSVLKRLWHALGYLSPWAVFKAEFPINLGYRSRLMADGTFGGADEFPLLPLRP